ncbi:pimeloyl-ACP methyl esterase BioG family protein [Sphingobacterium sp. E70]|uniref:pimeloyl-ACP methyl esterase BioG family protein n=1 Tax=Sphingobacterium sp. E70 TaxID=2853439 RepID=UPI00359C57E1
MGVWAASQVLPKLQMQHYPISTCTAINGTPFPIDDSRGIPVQVFRATLNTLSEKRLINSDYGCAVQGDIKPFSC